MARSNRKGKSKRLGGNPDRSSNTTALSARDVARRDAMSLITSGKDKLDGGDHDGAIADYEQAIAVDRTIALARRNRSDIAKAYTNRGIAKSEQGDLPEAIADYDRVISINPDAAIAYHSRGVAKGRQGDLPGAIADYDRVISINPDTAIAYHSRGVAKGRQGDLPGAIADYDRAISIDPDDAIAYNDRGVAKSEQGNLPGAIADYDRAISINPDDAIAYNNRGVAKSDQGDLPGAIADYDRAISINPDDAIAYNNRGIANWLKDDYTDAIADYDRVIELDPKNAKAFSNRGYIKWQKRDLQGAIADCEHSLKIDRDNVLAYANLSMVKWEQGAFTDARKYADRAIEMGIDAQMHPASYRFFRDVNRNIEKIERDREAAGELLDEAAASKDCLESKIEQMTAELNRVYTEQGHISESARRNNRSDATRTPMDEGHCRVAYYEDEQGRQPLDAWLSELDRQDQRDVRKAIDMMREGNFANSKSIHASGIFERRLRSGLRIYYARESPKSYRILHGGDKKNSNQDRDIKISEERWVDWGARYPN